MFVESLCGGGRLALVLWSTVVLVLGRGRLSLRASQKHWLRLWGWALGLLLLCCDFWGSGRLDAP
jgi:hypothetical protein